MIIFYWPGKDSSRSEKADFLWAFHDEEALLPPGFLLEEWELGCNLAAWVLCLPRRHVAYTHSLRREQMGIPISLSFSSCVQTDPEMFIYSDKKQMWHQANDLHLSAIP